MQSEWFKVGERVRDAGGREGIVVQVDVDDMHSARYRVRWDGGRGPMWYDGQPVARTKAPTATTAAEPVRAFRVGDTVKHRTSVVGEVSKVDGDMLHVVFRDKSKGYYEAAGFTLVASHEGEPAVPEWLREHVQHLPAGWRFVEGETHWYAVPPCGTRPPKWQGCGWTRHAHPIDREFIQHKVRHTADHLGIPDPYAPTIVDGAAVLPVLETPCPEFHKPNCSECGECIALLGDDEWSARKVLLDGTMVCRECQAPDLSLTNEVGFPTMPQPAVCTQAACLLPSDHGGECKYDEPKGDRLQPGDLVEWDEGPGSVGTGSIIEIDDGWASVQVGWAGPKGERMRVVDEREEHALRIVRKRGEL